MNLVASAVFTRMRMACFPCVLASLTALRTSAAMRRDLFKNLAPDVIAEAQKCAA